MIEALEYSSAPTSLKDIQEAIWRPDCPLVPGDVAGTYASYDYLSATYADSPPGKHQAHNQPPRFYAGHGCDEIDEALLLRLHRDTHPLGHMEQTHETFQQIATADPQYFTSGLVTLGRLGTLFHDTGETTHPETAALAGVANPPGDIHHGTKLPQHRVDEEKIRRTVYRTVLPGIPGDVVEAMEEVNSHRASLPAGGEGRDKHPLAVVFEAEQLAHRIDLVSVAAAAATAAMRARDFGGQVNHTLLEFGLELGSAGINSLTRYAETWRLAGTVASRHAWIPDMRAALSTRTIIT